MKLAVKLYDSKRVEEKLVSLAKFQTKESNASS